MSSETTLPPVTAVIPHRPPFLFVDEIVELTKERVVGKRTFRAEEDFFKGHFPEHPVVPGVILMEGLAQTMAYAALHGTKAERVFLIGIEKARFRAMITPGMTVTYEVTFGDQRFGTLTGKGKVRSGEQRVAEAELKGWAGDTKGMLG
jgi:3-hydroxyacyl-[acyl-carrier-protein] dehydratase